MVDSNTWTRVGGAETSDQARIQPVHPGIEQTMRAGMAQLRGKLGYGPSGGILDDPYADPLGYIRGIQNEFGSGDLFGDFSDWEGGHAGGLIGQIFAGVGGSAIGAILGGSRLGQGILGEIGKQQAGAVRDLLHAFGADTGTPMGTFDPAQGGFAGTGLATEWVSQEGSEDTSKGGTKGTPTAKDYWIQASHNEVGEIGPPDSNHPETYGKQGVLEMWATVVGKAVARAAAHLPWMLLMFPDYGDGIIYSPDAGLDGSEYPDVDEHAKPSATRQAMVMLRVLFAQSGRYHNEWVWGLREGSDGNESGGEPGEASALLGGKSHPSEWVWGIAE
jgi:hypothetical protein